MIWDVGNSLKKKLKTQRDVYRCYGKKKAERILEILSELEVAKNLGDISPEPPDRRHKMTNETRVWSIDITQNWRMWVQSDGPEDPLEVTSVTIIDILDDH